MIAKAINMKVTNSTDHVISYPTSPRSDPIEELYQCTYHAGFRQFWPRICRYHEAIDPSGILVNEVVYVNLFYDL